LRELSSEIDKIKEGSGPRGNQQTGFRAVSSMMGQGASSFAVGPDEATLAIGASGVGSAMLLEETVCTALV
jgi:hypothetical protein